MAESRLHRETLTVERVREVLDYDPETGIFKWKKKTGRKGHVGDVAGCYSRGYRYVRVDGTMYAEHRLAWFISFEEWPQHDIDHRDRNKSNNKLENLRRATRSQNLANTSKPSHNTSGYKGVSWSSANSKWQVHICVKGCRKYLGLFVDREDAAKAYEEYARNIHGDFAYGVSGLGAA